MQQNEFSHLDNLPAELSRRQQWVAYRLDPRLGEAKPAKMPYSEFGVRAKTNTPATWLSYEKARALARQGGFAGVGFVFSPHDPYTGIDLDKCRNPETEQIEDWARQIIEQLNSYTEVSPSGTGVHILVRGRLPQGSGACRRKGRIEMYDTGRFFVMTGQVLDGRGAIAERQDQLDEFYRKVFTREQSSPSSAPTYSPSALATAPNADADDAVLARAFAAKNGAKLQRLYLQGDITGYPSPSEADLALCGMLAFWTKDPAQIDRLFRNSKLMRRKWDERHGSGTYGQKTIARALVELPDAERHDFEDSGEPSSAPWDHVIELGLGDLPRFPTSALPDWQRNFVEALAEATQTPVDLAAQLTLGALAAAIHGKCEVEVRRDYREPLNLFVATVAESGERKTAVYSEVTRPLTAWDMEQREAQKAHFAEARANRSLLEKRLERAQQEAAKATTENDRIAPQKEMLSLARELAQTPHPVEPRLWTDDTTAEALANLLSEQQGRMAVFASEGGGLFDIMHGRYSNGPNFDVYLKGHAGEPFRVDRRNAASFDVPKATLTLVLTMQRAVLQTFGEKSAELRGRGLLARFLYSLPPTTLGTRNPNSTPLPERVENAYAVALRELLALRPAANTEAVQSPHRLALSPEAWACWLSFAGALEPRLGPTGDLHPISDWASKLTGAAVRLAGLLHCARERSQPWGTPIARSTMADAVTIANYLIAHARAAFRLMTLDQAIVDAEYLLRHIRQREAQTFTKRDLFQWTKSHFQQVGDLDLGLRTLVEHNYIRKLDKPEERGVGRPRSTGYAVNPELYSQNPQNSVAVAEF